MKRVILTDSSLGRVLKVVDSNRTLKCPIDRYVSCGEWCAWFDTEEKWRSTSPEEGFFGSETYIVITCKCNPIAELDDDSVNIEIEE